jgi:hypothetical protein
MIIRAEGLDLLHTGRPTWTHGKPDRRIFLLTFRCDDAID